MTGWPVHRRTVAPGSDRLREIGFRFDAMRQDFGDVGLRVDDMFHGHLIRPRTKLEILNELEEKFAREEASEHKRKAGPTGAYDPLLLIGSTEVC